MYKYVGLYTHRNKTVWESAGEGRERILAYSSTDLLEYLGKENRSSYFSKINEYNGMKVNVLYLENGYKLIGVTNEAETGEKELAEQKKALMKRILSKEYDEVEEEAGGR